ncbi:MULTISPECIES: TonB-dependent receptor domain-containing protein [unclassified Helicobacter]|uniref:TonB-dependent receptor domain-containing protein n=1 Tax=unclassified Helicobacter TaxID=2593540 RepID=UPI0013155338|nr:MULTISPECIES: TonB-dependent receptor [unclassified Helicobacter]
MKKWQRNILMVLFITGKMVLAQDEKKDTEGKDYDLDSIVTSATGFEQDRKDAPATISVVTSEEILSRPIKDLGDAVQDVPGVYVEQTKTGQNQIYMRGLGSEYTLILIDGRRQNVNSAFNTNGFNGAHSSFMPPASMIERIEVIRGPASVVYGTDAMGGVINIITKKNPQKFTGSIQLDATIQEQRKNFGDNYGANMYIATPLIKDKLSLSLRGGGKYNDANYFYAPIVTSANGNPYTTHSPGKWYSYNAGGRLDYILDDSNNFYFDGEYYHITNTSLNTSGRSISATNDFNKLNLAFSHDGKYSWGKMQSYVQYALTDRIPQSTTGFGNVGGSLNYGAMIRNQDVAVSSMYNHDFSFGKAGDLALTSGIYYLYESLINKGQKFNRDMHQLAAFAEGQYFINRYVSTTLGLRYNWANLYTARPNPRFYVNVNPTSWFTIKMGIASGMKIPSLSQSYNGLYNIDTSGNYYYGTKDLQAEKSWNYEVSLIFDTKPVYIIATTYYTDFTDQIQTNTATSGTTLPGGFTCQGVQCYYFDNVDRSFMTGFEFSLQTKAFYGVSFDTSYAFTYTEQLSGTKKGLPVNSIPKHKLMAKIKYTYEKFSTYLRLQGNFLTPTLPSNRGGNPREILGAYYKDYVLLDWAMSYKFLKFFTATFSINNLLNTNFIDFAIAANGRNYVNSYQRYLPGRNYWFSLKMDF